MELENQDKLRQFMNCVIDQGNTRTKIYFFQKEELIKAFTFLNNEVKAIESTLNKEVFVHGIYSSSSKIAAFINKEKFLILSNETPLPIRLDYKTPESLGTDRIALAAGAYASFPGKNCLIISAGTCITIDIIDEHAVFQGGIISPGIDMRRIAMHKQTANLPLLSQKKVTEISLIGKSTKESMESGVINGVIAEISSTIDQFQSIYNDLTIIITGGDAYLFELHLKNKIFAQANLQAIGLNRILLYNAD